MKTYLAGPINGKTDAECKNWRDAIKRLMPDCVDPMTRDFRGREAENVEAIVEGDKADIDACNVVLVHYSEPSVGTAMEVLYAWETGIRVVVWDVSGKPLSPWLRYHAHSVVETLEQAVEACR
jgi:nucleoside 2-deoxyribosyltransferase